jgi:hypothetical protein
MLLGKAREEGGSGIEMALGKDGPQGARADRSLGSCQDKAYRGGSDMV